MSQKLRLAALTFLVALTSYATASASATKPNFIIIFTDDQGYNDLGCFGSETIKTPHIDQLAKEGKRFTSFYVAANVCTPSRAALLTGTYPKRVDLVRGLVIFPANDYGLHPDEVTIAEVLKSAGYATACVGKWHLGHRPPFLPTRQGFDSYFGIPYSNDMAHPDNRKTGARATQWKGQEESWKNWKTPLMEGEEIIECPVDQRTITRRYTDKAIEFIKKNGGKTKKPFFLYLPHSMPHVPLYVPTNLYDPDCAQPYKAVIEQIDSEVGRLVKTVGDLGLADNTYIIFTSDNGPAMWARKHGGSAKPLRAAKGSTYEGGHRVPCVMWGPGHIPADTTSAAFITSMDLLPTIAKLAGVTFTPRGRIDGMDVSAVILDKTGKVASPRTEMLYYSNRGALHGIRQGDWKLRITLPRPRRGQPQKPALVELYNLIEDIGETTNLAKKMPEKVAALKARMIELDAEITKNARPRGEFSTPEKAEKAEKTSKK